MADDSKRLVELNTQLADLADKSSQLEKELQKIKMAGQGIGTTLPHNFRKASAAVDQLSAKIKQLETAQNRLATSGGAVGAARISAAHSTLTGLGRGGGGYGSSGGFMPFPQNPFPGRMDEIPRGGGGGSGGNLLTRLMAKILEMAGSAAKRAIGGSMGAAYQSSIMAIRNRQSFEEQTRFLRAGSLEQGIGSLGNLIDSETGNLVAYHGYNARESAAHRIQLLRAAGGMSEELSPMVGTEKAFQAMSNRLRNPVQNLIGAAGVLAGGGFEAEDSIKVLQRIQTTLENIEGINSQTPEYLRTSSIYLDSLQQLAQQQLAVSGALSQAQMGAFQGVVSKLSTDAGFDPTQASAIANIMQQRTISPGGGAAGEIFQMQAFGFANANIGAFKKTAQARGIDPAIFKRRGLFEYRDFMENATLAQKAQAYMVGLETKFGNRPDAMAYILGTSLMPELGQTRARELVGMYQRGGLSTAQIEQYMKESPAGATESALDVAKSGTTEQTATFMKFKNVHDAYADTILEFGGKGGLESLNSINQALRDFQITLASVASNIGNIELIKELLAAAAGLSGKAGAFANTSPREVVVPPEVRKNNTTP